MLLLKANRKSYLGGGGVQPRYHISASVTLNPGQDQSQAYTVYETPISQKEVGLKHIHFAIYCWQVIESHMVSAPAQSNMTMNDLERSSSF